MNLHSKHRLRHPLLLAGIVLPTLLIAALCFGQSGQDKKAVKPETSGKKFKNIKVLKDLPANQLIPVMHKINKSLGVGCDYCHVMGPNHTGFEKDDKPAKNKCRQMMTMTGDLNKRYKTVERKVTCFTCHQGHAQPPVNPDKE